MQFCLSAQNGAPDGVVELSVNGSLKNKEDCLRGRVLCNVGGHRVEYCWFVTGAGRTPWKFGSHRSALQNKQVQKLLLRTPVSTVRAHVI